MYANNEEKDNVVLNVLALNVASKHNITKSAKQTVQVSGDDMQMTQLTTVTIKPRIEAGSRIHVGSSIQAAVKVT